MSAAVASLLPRLRPLIGKLGSMHDGEIVAAARAIQRLLEREGLNFNDVGAALDGAGEHRPDLEREPDVVLRSWPAAVAWIAQHPFWDPSAHELEFIASIGRILGRRSPSEKQQKWLRGIGRSAGRPDPCLNFRAKWSRRTGAPRRAELRAQQTRRAPVRHERLAEHRPEEGRLARPREGRGRRRARPDRPRDWPDKRRGVRLAEGTRDRRRRRRRARHRPALRGSYRARLSLRARGRRARLRHRPTPRPQGLPAEGDGWLLEHQGPAARSLSAAGPARSARGRSRLRRRGREGCGRPGLARVDRDYERRRAPGSGGTNTPTASATSGSSPSPTPTRPVSGTRRPSWASCRKRGIPAAILRLDGLPEKGDVSDWLERGWHARPAGEAG